MGKFYGAIGYAESIETAPGVWEEKIIEKVYSGDMRKDMSRIQSGENINDNLRIDNMLSIVADPYAFQNFHNIRYIRWMGAKWKITSIEVNNPRLTMYIGGVYNEQSTGTSGFSE